MDWSPDMNGDTAEARRATEFEFYKAFMEGAWLLSRQAMQPRRINIQARAQAMRRGIAKNLLDPQANTFGGRWQSNAMAIYSGVADATQTSAIYDRVLSHAFWICDHALLQFLCDFCHGAGRSQDRSSGLDSQVLGRND